LGYLPFLSATNALSGKVATQEGQPIPSAAAIPKASVLALGSQAQGKGPVVRALENLPKQIS